MSNGDQVTEYATPTVADGTTANVADQVDVQNGPSGYHYNVPRAGHDPARASTSDSGREDGPNE